MLLVVLDMQSDVNTVFSKGTHSAEKRPLDLSELC